jgi:hypothetical protein
MRTDALKYTVTKSLSLKPICVKFDNTTGQVPLFLIVPETRQQGSGYRAFDGSTELAEV